MRFTRLVAAVALVLACGTFALAEDDEEKKADSEEFQTTWIGIRPELWYQPALSLTAQVGGIQGISAFIVPENTRLDVHDDLGVQNNTPKPSYLDNAGGPIGLDVFVDTRWVSIDLWAVTPFEYKGNTVLTRDITYAGVTFQVSRPVETVLEQALAGFDIKVNLLNNRFVRVSPILAMRALAINWTVRDTGGGPITAGRASTEDIDFPLTVGRFKVLPYPEVGAEVRAGYRDFVELDLKLTGCYVEYSGVRATTALFEVGVTGYLPFLNNIGLRLGYRYFYFNARTSDQTPKAQFEADMRMSGATVSLIARF